MFSWIVTGLLLLANYLTGQKQKSGWLVGIVADISFGVYGAVTKQYGFVFGSAVFVLLRARNYIKWREADLRASSRRKEEAGRLMAGEPRTGADRESVPLAPVLRLDTARVLFGRSR